MPDEPQSELAIAAHRVVEGRQIVARQTEMIARLEALGYPTGHHEHALRLFKDSLRIFEERERQLWESAGCTA
jgi:hypothetical protein